MTEDTLEAIIQCTSEKTWSLPPGKAPWMLWWKPDVGVSTLVTYSEETEQGALHTVVFTPKYALTWREIRKLNITDSD